MFSPRTRIALIVAMLFIAAGIYWWMTREPEKKEPEVVFEEVVEAPPSIPVREVIEEGDPFAGDKFIITKRGLQGVIVPQNDKIILETSGVRTDDMIITFHPVSDEMDTYLLQAKGIDKYFTFREGREGRDSFKSQRKIPSDDTYKIKITKIGEDYVMSYMKNDTEMFFGFDESAEDGEKLFESDKVTDLTAKGLINFEDVAAAGMIIPGHFGTNPVDQYGDNEVEDIAECLSLMHKFEPERKKDILSVSYNQTEPRPCRTYKNDENYEHDPDAAGWTSMCVDPEKDISQGCLINR